jgi:hypothetical protein
MEQELVNFFKHLLTEPEAERQPTIQKITHHIPHLVSVEQNESLMCPISLEKVEQVVFEMS